MLCWLWRFDSEMKFLRRKRKWVAGRSRELLHFTKFYICKGNEHKVYTYLTYRTPTVVGSTAPLI